MLLGTWVQERKGPVRGLESRSGRRAQAGGAAGAGWGLAGGWLGAGWSQSCAFRSAGG